MAQRGRQSNNEGTGTSKKNTPFKYKAKTEETTVQKTRFQATRINQSEENPKTKEKLSKKKQQYMANQRKQNAIPLGNQIKSEIAQINWREKTTTESVKKKLTLQFGFAANPSYSRRHNTSNALADTPTWYYFFRPSHVAFHDFTK